MARPAAGRGFVRFLESAMHGQPARRLGQAMPGEPEPYRADRRNQRRRPPSRHAPDGVGDQMGGVSRKDVMGVPRGHIGVMRRVVKRRAGS